MNQLEVSSPKTEFKKMVNSMIYPFFFVAVLWLIKILELGLEISFTRYGLRPLTLEGMLGIVAAPLIHGSEKDAIFNHLINNSIPLLILGSSLFYFYKAIAFRVTLWSWILGGLFVWIVGRDSYHIGASGVVYAWASFLFFSGLFREIVQLVAISLIVVFLYGSFIWGVFPIEEGISWESHFAGGVIGLFLAIIYRKQGPKPAPLPDWMYEEDEGIDMNVPDNPDLNPPFNYRNHT